MATLIFDFPYDFAPYDFPVGYRREWERRRVDLGDGYEKVNLRGVPVVQPDGIGGVSAQRGRTVFTIRLNQADYDGDQLARQVIAFLQARVEANEPFYFYNFLENDDRSTWTGDTTSDGTDRNGNPVTNETGRYLVMFMDEELIFEWPDSTVINFPELVFWQVRQA